jgi:hypothetical protein
MPTAHLADPTQYDHTRQNGTANPFLRPREVITLPWARCASDSAAAALTETDVGFTASGAKRRKRSGYGEDN